VEKYKGGPIEVSILASERNASLEAVHRSNAVADPFSQEGQENGAALRDAEPGQREENP